MFKKIFFLFTTLLSITFLFSSNYKFINFEGKEIKISYEKNFPCFLKLKDYKLQNNELLNPGLILENLKYPLKIEKIYKNFNLEEEWTSLSGIHLRFKANFKGIQVFNSYIDLHINDKKELYSIFEKVFNTKISHPQKLNESDSLEIAEKSFEKKYGRKFSLKNLYKVFYIGKDNNLIPSTYVELKKKNSPLDVKYVVSLLDGKILFETSNIYYFDGNGRIFNPNPVNSLRNINLRDMGDSNNAISERAYQEVLLKDISKDENDLFILNGPNVKVKDIEYPYIAPPKSQDGSFNYYREDDGFEAVMVYYWIDKACRYLKSLGFDIYPYPLSVDPHGVNGADQSHFSAGSSPYIAYGDGGVDDAEDADIILHEMGHSIQYFQNKNAFVTTGESGAIGEGFGDYWAFSNTYNISVANGFDPFCIGEWDSTSYSNSIPPCLRRVDSNKKYPDDMDGEIHDDGEIWSSCLREIFMKLGKEITDSIVLEGQYHMPPSTNFRNGALSIIEADENLYNGNHTGLICNIFYNRGILSEGDCRSHGPFVNLYNVDFSELDGNGDEKADPGEIYKMDLSFYNSGTVDTGKIFIKIIPEDPSIKILNNLLSINNLPHTGAIIHCENSIIFKIGSDFQCGEKAKFLIKVYNDGLEFNFQEELQIGEISSNNIFEDDLESGGSSLWQISIGAGTTNYEWQLKETPYSHSQNHSYFAIDTPQIQDSYLTLGPIDLSNEKLYYLHFFHTYSFEIGYDGGVVEISTDGGNNFQDLGNYFTQNGYNMKISDKYGSPIGGRMAFSGGSLSTQLKESIINLSSFSGNTIYIRFRASSDQSNGGSGWYIDDISIEEITPTCSLENFTGDLNGDGNKNIEDVLLLKNLLVENLYLNNYLKDVGDINGDGKLNLLDLQILLMEISQ